MKLDESWTKYNKVETEGCVDLVHLRQSVVRHRSENARAIRIRATRRILLYTDRCLHV